MRSPTEPAWLEEPGTFWMLAGLIVLLFALTNLPWTLDDYDQAKQAYTSFEMVEGGQWLYQHTPNGKTATKPPLLGWISAGLYSSTGSWELAWRLPPLLSALILLGVIYRAAANAFGAAAGLMALGAAGLNFLSPRLATLVRTDMTLALLIFLLGWQIWQKVRRNEPWEFEDRLIAFLLLAAAMLIKGPIVYAFLWPGLVAFHFWKRRRAPQVRAWCGWSPWFWSLVLFLGWAVGGIFFMPGFFDDVVMKEFLGRFGETAHRPQPFYFYLPHLLWRMAPWSVLLLAFAVLLRRERGAARPPMQPETAWLVCWVLGALVVMSLIPSKRVDRIYPVVPPLALLLGLTYQRLVAREELRARARQWATLTLLAAAVAATGYTTARIYFSWRADDAALTRFAGQVREEAARHDWQYAVVGKRHEGLLLYLGKLRFVSLEEAARLWREGAIDAVVAPDDERARLLRDLEGSIPAWPEVRSPRKRNAHYIMLARSRAP